MGPILAHIRPSRPGGRWQLPAAGPGHLVWAHRPLILEIGCGTGTSTAAMALQEPDFDVLAVEVYRKGLAQLLSTIDREGIENIRLIRGDALDVLEHLLPSGSLTAARVFSRTLAQGPPSQAAAAAAGHCGAAIRPSAPGRHSACGHRSRELRRAHRRGRRRRTHAAATEAR